ncbi:ATPase [Peptoniphilus equinus]|uniref:ATPase n=1 Tax=Peptoniphilus equinus TaxID=3016343 RepID=A0ABY7QV84_9FIRM|nr:ATPase [Peptoniphilus equinus]WBW50694.1 ATPase [Peptoniphilus equinus]
MTLNELDAKIAQLERAIHIKIGQQEVLQRNLQDAESKVETLHEENELLSQVEVLLSLSSDYGREQAKLQIESLVSNCLSFIFETDISFVIELTENGKIAGADFYVVSSYDGYSIKTKPELSRGGGVVDIVSIALRIAMIEIFKPHIEGPLILDEPGKHVSEDFIFNLGEFLRKSSTMFKRQIIMVTHNKYLAQICDRSFYVEQKNAVSSVQELTQDV